MAYSRQVNKLLIPTSSNSSDGLRSFWVRASFGSHQLQSLSREDGIARAAPYTSSERRQNRPGSSEVTGAPVKRPRQGEDCGEALGR